MPWIAATQPRSAQAAAGGEVGSGAKEGKPSGERLHGTTVDTDDGVGGDWLWARAGGLGGRGQRGKTETTLTDYTIIRNK